MKEHKTIEIKRTLEGRKGYKHKNIKASVAIPVPGKIGFKECSITKDNEILFIKAKRSLLKEGITILNMYAPNNTFSR